MSKSLSLILVLFFTMILLQACLPIGWINKDYWTCNSTDSSVYLSKSLYLEMIDGKNGIIWESMILYNDGFCAIHYKKEFWKHMSLKQYGRRSNVDWGRYKLLNDSIVIQFFHDTGCGGGSPFIFTVHQLAGKILFDGSVNISSFEFNNACANGSAKKGYIKWPINVQLFTIKDVPFPNDNTNWLQRKNIK